MFSALSQGSYIYILDKTEFKLKVGTITSISLPRNNFNLNSLVIDIKCNVNGNTLEYTNIPSSYSLVTYNNGLLVISETKQGLQLEVENNLNTAKDIIKNIDVYKLLITLYESILKELNPQFAKDLERDTRLTNLEFKFEGVENKLDKILNLVTNKTNSL